MAARVPRLVVIGVLTILVFGAVAFAAEQKLAPSTTTVAAKPLVQQRTVLTVPDVRNQAFTFAKGTLQDDGFSWRVTGAVRGYPANKVATQTPPAGTHVYDTGAPLVTLTLTRNAHYPQQGMPQDVSPYRATATEVADAAASQLQAPPATTTPAAPGATTPSTTTPAPATKPVSKPAAPAPAHAKPAAPSYPQSRPPAFLVSGAPKEPLDEMPLVDRARALDRWLSAHPHPTNASVKYWLYQNAWVVTGARFGWWHGADALRVLIRVDQRAEALWGIGVKSEAVARGALAEVEARSR